jgi:Tol biopolymer transport system component
MEISRQAHASRVTWARTDRVDGRDARRLTAGPTIDTQPAVSPNGTRHAFESNRDGNSEVA